MEVPQACGLGVRRGAGDGNRTFALRKLGSSDHWGTVCASLGDGLRTDLGKCILSGPSEPGRLHRETPTVPRSIWCACGAAAGAHGHSLLIRSSSRIGQ